jgi:hypothetical protein
MKKILIAGIIMAFIQFGFTDIVKAKPVIPLNNTNRKNATIKTNAKRAGHGADSKKFFTLKVNNGDKLGNIFTRTISYKGDDFPEVVFRVGGTGVYTVIDNNPLNPVFDGVFRYDGWPESKGRDEIRDTGKTNIYIGKSSVNTDGSGVMFNALIWGNPPAKLKKGDTWKVSIPQPWELGGVGTQIITVIDIDENNNSIRLQREGSSGGFYDNDAKKISITKDGKAVTMTVTPGTSHWIGYTTFKNGLVISDELLVSRPITLTADNLNFDAFEREYILLNAMPVS